MIRSATIVVLAAFIAGCGGSIEDRVRDEYGDYAKKHDFGAGTQEVERVECTNEATRDYDGWCRIRPKGFRLTYDVPYRDDKPLWGESGVSEAPES